MTGTVILRRTAGAAAGFVRPVLGAVLALGVGSAPALAADVLTQDADGVNLSLTLDAGMGLFAVSNANFGTGNGRDDSPTWAEVFVKPGVAMSYTLSGGSAVYGGTSVIGAMTGGEGDAAGTTNTTPEDVDLEDAYVGWRSGGALESWGEDALDLSIGRQSFVIGDGFLISDGHADGGQNAAYWLAPRTAYRMAAVARVNTQPVRGDLFYLEHENNLDRRDYTVAGGNVEYTIGDIGSVGGAYIRVLDTDTTNVAYDDMNVYDLRTSLTPVASLPGLAFSGEITRETGGANIDAWGWYGQVAYTLTETPWAPSISYRYAHFSGDDTATGDNEAFNPLFYGLNGGWGTWFMGEVTGEYLLGNSNNIAHTVHLSAQPLENLGVGLLLFRFEMDQPAAYGATDKHFADEIDVHADWGVTDNISISGVYGASFPGAGGKQVYGGAKTEQVFQLITMVSF